MSIRARIGLVVAAFALSIAAVLGGQALTDARTAAAARAGAGATVGRAAFSYLSGLRALVAYQLWNRIEPIDHQYYQGVMLDQSYYMIPTARIVMVLKPDFPEPYYILPWVLARNGKIGPALELAAEGVDANPRSGLLIMSYAQVLAVVAQDWSKAAALSDRALGTDVVWTDDTQKWQSLRVAEEIYRRDGQTGKADALGRMLDELSKRIDAASASPDALGNAHDHNGDGVPDH